MIWSTPSGMCHCVNRHRILVGVILLAHFGLLSHTITTYSPTIDEISHLPAGLSHWRFGRFDLYRVNPPLVEGVAAVPLLLCEFKEDWSQYSFQKNARREFVIGKRFVWLNGADSMRLYRYGRRGKGTVCQIDPRLQHGAQGKTGGRNGEMHAHRGA